MRQSIIILETPQAELDAAKNDQSYQDGAASQTEQYDAALHTTAFEDREKLKTEYTEQCKILQTRENELKKLLSNPVLPPSPLSTGMPCPDCQASLLVKSGVLVKYDQTSATNEFNKQTTAHNSYKTQQSAAQDHVNTESDKKRKLEAAINEKDLIVQKQETLKQNADAPKADKINYQPQIDTLTNKVQELGKLKIAIEAWGKAVKAHRAVMGYQKLAEALSPEGIRSSWKTVTVDKVNNACKQLCETIGWQAITLNASDYSITFGDYPYAVLSKSEQWRAAFLLRLASALLLEDRYFLADDCDILDIPNKQAVYKAIYQICENYPDLRMFLVGTDFDRDIPEEVRPKFSRIALAT